MAHTVQDFAGRLGAWYGHGPDKRTLVGIALAIVLAVAATIAVSQLHLGRHSVPAPIPVPEEITKRPTVTQEPAVEALPVATPESPRVINFDQPFVIHGRVRRHVAR